MAAVEVLIKESTPPTKGRKRWQHPEFGGFELARIQRRSSTRVITVNNDIWLPAATIEQAHQQALPGVMRICSSGQPAPSPGVSPPVRRYFA
jgi:hypothetical protein